MYSRISRRKIIKKKAQKWGKTQINALSPYGNVSFERDKDKSVCFSRRVRKERKDLFPFVFHACAGVVANFVTTRVRREFIHPLLSAGLSARRNGDCL